MKKPSEINHSTPYTQQGTLDTAKNTQHRVSQFLIPADGSVLEESDATRFKRDGRYGLRIFND